MRSRGPPEEPGARKAGGSEARPEALRASARTGGTEDTEVHRGDGSPPRCGGGCGFSFVFSVGSS